MQQQIQRIWKSREKTPVLFLIGLFLAVGLFNSTFLNPDNLLQILNGSVVLTLVSGGIAFVILTGEIDVSVGAVLGVSAAVSATLLRDGASLPTAVLASLAIGLVVGLINAVGIVFFKIPSIIMTLGINGIVRGLSYVFTSGKWVENLPSEFKALSLKNVFLNLSWFYFVTILVVIAGSLALKKTRHGKYFAAIGDNIDGAVLVGIPATKVKLGAFIISSVSAALAGVLFASRIGFVTPTSGLGYEMKAIAACVLGGISLTGGVGSLFGAAVGAVIMSSISRILVFLKFPSEYDNMITGIMLITIVVIDAVTHNRSVERARRTRLLARTQNGEKTVRTGENQKVAER